MATVEEARLVALAEDILEWIEDDCERFFGEEISEDFAPMMAEHGFLVREAYDPKKHGEEPPDGIEEGDEAWWLTHAAHQAALSSFDRRHKCVFCPHSIRHHYKKGEALFCRNCESSAEPTAAASHFEKRIP